MSHDTLGHTTSPQSAIPSGGQAVTDGRGLLEQLGDLLQEAAGDATMSHRLARAETTVRFVLADDERASMTLLLDREPIEVVADAQTSSCEIELVLPSHVLRQLFHGDYHLTMAIVRGDVTFRGPVRKLLLVMPILQHFAETEGLEDHGDREAGPRAADAA